MAKYNLNNIKKNAGLRSKVGIFWFVNNNIVSFDRDVLAGEKRADAPYDHMHVWDKMLKGYPSLRGKDYYNVPRGRVTLVDGIFNILIGSDIQNSNIVSKICKEYNIPRDRYQVIIDDHYETQPVDPLMSLIMENEEFDESEAA